MTKIYRKNELTFSLICIAFYIVSFSIADSASKSLGILKSVTVPVCIAIVLILWLWMCKNNLFEKYGLCAIKGRAADYLYFIPLAVIASVNLWNGFGTKYTALETVLYVISMLCVGFIEEIIFRGFLFKALCRENVTQAIAISSVTFGIGHIVNLLNGADVASTLLQLCYACAVGFLFTVIFYKSGSIIPCIIAHGVFNSLSAFSVQGTQTRDVITAAVLTVAAVIYAIYILKHTITSHEKS